MKLELSFAMHGNPRNRAIFDGRAQPDGIDFICHDIRANELFWRQLRFAEFDVSEMSISSLLMIMAKGDTTWLGLPVFTTRHFFHTMMLARKDAGIDGPKDMAGKRVGVPEFQQTAALWARGALKHEWGVEQETIEWWMERTPEHSHAHATGFKTPKGTTINQIPPDKSIGSMLVAGELDATLIYFGNEVNIIDRTAIDLHTHPDIKRVFPDPMAEGVRYFEKTGVFPINHAMVIRRSVAEKYPWAPMSIYKAMVAANEIADRERIEHMAYHLETGQVPPEYKAAVARPVVRYGLKANRKTIETAAQYSNEQGLTPRVMAMEEIFAPSTMDE